MSKNVAYGAKYTFLCPMSYYTVEGVDTEYTESGKHAGILLQVTEGWACWYTRSGGHDGILEVVDPFKKRDNKPRSYTFKNKAYSCTSLLKFFQ